MRRPLAAGTGPSPPGASRFFIGVGDGELHRRPLDWVRLVVAIALLAALATRVGDEATAELDLAQALAHAADWVHDGAVGVHRLASLWLVAAVVVAVAWACRWRLARDIAIAALVAWTCGRGLAVLVAGDGFDDLTLTGEVPPFPLTRVAVVTALLAAAAPHLTRPARRIGQASLALAVAAAAVATAAVPGDVVGGVLLGLAVGAAVHLCFGSPLGRPSVQQVLDGLQELGVDAGPILQVSQRRGIVRVEAALDHELLVGTAAGRDAADAGLLARLWRAVWYKGGAARVLATRRQQVAGEALVTLLAERAGVAAPRLLAAGTAGDDMAVLAVRQPRGRPLGGQPGAVVDDAVLDRLWHEIRRLHEARVAHRSLDGSRVIVGGRGEVTLVDFADAEYDAPPRQLARDVAELLVTTALVAGPERAVAAAVRGIGGEAVTGSLPYIQTPVLTEANRLAVHRRDKDADDKLLASVRTAAAEATAAELPELAQLHRIRVRDVVLVAATALGATLLLSQLNGLGDVLDELANARWGWVLVAFVAAFLTSPADAVAVTGAVDAALQFGPTTLLQYAQKFTNLVVPTSVGSAAMSARFLSTQGVPIANAVVSGVLVSVAGFVVQLGLLVTGLVLLDVSFDVERVGGGGNTAQVVVLVLFGLVAVISLVWFVPALHRRIVPHVQSARHDVRALVSSPKRLALVIGGNLASQVVYAFVLGCCVQAYGYHLDLGTLIVVNTVATLFAGVMPIPGGIGVAEGALTAGLTAAGVPSSAAVTAAVTHRLVTFYLPPIWGWFALRWLTRRGYV